MKWKNINWGASVGILLFVMGMQVRQKLQSGKPFRFDIGLIGEALVVLSLLFSMPKKSN
jgi:hypothetical protein